MSNTKEKLTEYQLRIVQVIAGIISGAALIVALFVAGRGADGNIFLTYLWLIVFVVVMFGRRWIERKFRLRLSLYNLVLINTLLVGILIYLGIIFYSPAMQEGESAVQLSDAVKLIIMIVPAVAMLILGIAMPIKRYFKRKEDGTLRDVRLPEPTEEEEAAQESSAENSGPMTIEQQVAAMTRELDGDKDEEDEEQK